MNLNQRELAILPIAILLIGGFLWLELKWRTSRVPDFSAIENVKEKKETFFSFMQPIIYQVNDEILRQRRDILGYQQKMAAGGKLSGREEKHLDKLIKTYRLTAILKTENDRAAVIQKLLQRVDIIPPSLALAQSANESAWGTARFARQGNNYFGLWCWSLNCGMLPTDRDVGAKHEVAAFETVGAGVVYYMKTLNSHPAYQALRDKRYELRAAGEPLSGAQLAQGLIDYSERREAYVEEIRAMISYNKLERFDRKLQSP